MIGSIVTSRRQVLNGNPVQQFILQSPNTTKWVVRIDSNGILKTHSGAAGAVTDIKVTGGSVGESSFAIDNNGQLQTKNDGDLSGTATLNNDFRMRAEDGTIYKLDVSAEDEIQTISI